MNALALELSSDLTTTLADDIADRIALADHPAGIDGILADARVDHTHGRLTIDDLDVVKEAARTRRAELARAARSRTRRRLHDPRPPIITPEIRKRIRQWENDVEEAANAHKIGDGERLYADKLLAFHTIRGGLHSMCSDATMGGLLGKSRVTARRRRTRLDKAGLIEVGTHGEDGNSCLVIPILKDGTPVFPDPEMPTRPRISDRGGCSKVSTDSSTYLQTESPPPLPPSVAVPDDPEEGGRALDRIEAGAAEGHHEAPTPIDVPKVAADGAEAGTAARQELAGPPAARGVPTPPPSRKTSPAASAAMMFFPRLWAAAAVGRTERETGPKGYALAECLKLSAAAQANLMEIVSRPGFRPPRGVWIGTWIKGGVGVWEEAAPVAAAAGSPAMPVPPRPAPVPPASPEGKAQVAAALESYRRGRVPPLMDAH